MEKSLNIKFTPLCLIIRLRQRQNNKLTKENNVHFNDDHLTSLNDCLTNKGMKTQHLHLIFSITGAYCIQ